MCKVKGRGVVSTTIKGNPGERHISTSFVERQNLTMRMQIRRFTRLTNGFSKKLENLKAALALHFAHYNFVRVHRTLRVTPQWRQVFATEFGSYLNLLDHRRAQCWRSKASP